MNLLFNNANVVFWQIVVGVQQRLSIKSFDTNILDSTE